MAYELAIITPEVLKALEPRPDIRSWDWINQYGRMANGQPFDGDRVPWCEGVCDAYDSSETRTITMMWGTRLGKTSIALQLMACMMATAPMPGLITGSTQSLVKRVVRKRVYPMLRCIDATRDQLPSEKKQSWEAIQLAKSTWNVAWSGSATALADVDAFYGHAFEIDKWSFNETLGGDAGEGDPLDQWEERFKEFIDAKRIYECSPTTAMRSRIYKKLKVSNDCRFFVPCPKCRERQQLVFGGKDARDTGGLVFDRLPDGSHDSELARTTARYVCQHCRKEIYDDQRFQMMRSGVWVPAGCYVDRKGKIHGTPTRSTRNWGGQLSSLYSLQLRWGDIAAEFVNKKPNPKSLQMFVNGWLAEVWEPHRTKSEPEDVAERLRSIDQRGTIPEWATWVFRGCDVQEEYMVHATIAVGPGVGPELRWHVLDAGAVDTWDELDEVIKRGYPHETGKMPAALTLIDSAHRTAEVYSFCGKYKGTPHVVLPCKGANNDCNGEPFQRILIGDGTKSGSKRTKRLALLARGLIRIRVSPFHYEPIIQKQLDEQDDAKRILSVADQLADDMDFITQVCNGVLSEVPSKTSPDHHLWIKRWENQPNDFRDCLRYARCAADVKFRGDWRRAQVRQVAHLAEPPRKPVQIEREPVRSGRTRARSRPRTRRRTSRRR